MHAVLNRLRFQDEIDPSVFAAVQSDLVPGMRMIEGFEGSSLFGVAYGDCDVSVVTVLGS